MTNVITQFKLTNSDEIICEIVEWNNEEQDDVIISKAMRIVEQLDATNGVKYYIFKPFMTFQSEEETTQLLNSTHIISQAKPSMALLEYYNSSLKAQSESDEVDSDFEDTFDSLSNDKTDKILH